MKCIIFSGADIIDYNFVASYIDEDDFIICADSGVRHAEKLGLVANVVIGDFDSVTDNGYKKHKEVVTLPCEKDDTDTFAAAKIAAENSPDEVLIFGAIGSRIDHTLGNISTLEFLHQKAPCRFRQGASLRTYQLFEKSTHCFPCGHTPRSRFAKNRCRDFCKDAPLLFRSFVVDKG